MSKSFVKINFILFDSAIELIPKEISNHPAILSDSKRKGILPERMILDRATHHFAMSKLEDSERRGRPDIVHTTLLVATDSPAYRNGYMKVFVHTYDGRVLAFRDGVKPPVNYNNFVRLMSQLLHIGRVPVHGKPLIETYSGTLKNLLEQTNSFVVLFTSRGKRLSFMDILQRFDQSVITILVGGYPRGPPRDDFFEFCDEAISIYDGVLTSWTVTSRAIYDLERFFLKF